MKRLFLMLLVALMVATPAAPVLAQAQHGDRFEVAQQQQPRRRTLFDLLFGEEPAPAPPPVQKTQPRQSAPTAALPPAKPQIEKASDATRLAVFGDSLAVDLGRALERLYAEDPNLVVLGQGVGSSGFVRDDYFDWNAAIRQQIAADSFDLAIIFIGVNDRQEIRVGNQRYAALTDGWTAAYQARLNDALGALRAARKPVIWIGLPPMSRSDYSTAMSQISALQKLAAFSGGAEFLDIYDRFLGEDGRYSDFGPDMTGQNARMRKEDGIHLSAAGSDKLAFYVSQSIRSFYRGGGMTLAVVDPLAGTDAASMLRPPFQGVGQTRLLEVAGAVMPLSRAPQRAGDLVLATGQGAGQPAFSLDQLMQAPKGRVDDFGVGSDPEAINETDGTGPTE